ncbi:IDEAL domain-containing protein [Domibacillus sp. DTU_2020_1001157_1_SI_ALB_TIR_016]|uniref:IDEAL domain-containing protein n=1 Tax=Domibacillus sp. DTU_2020_1001157_1_SI_ALB_TIR_016 TaxID=3077789 RepID=UPI0028E66095|nr:IDEAL domain-containing protein [Domibacillus sp. DTU_2020_1001157_1_SI_ALB_TIR_016]WNS78055.1 IDEAL domain-containing protein [Domibacillus sp. DTU_2020_1001157_1_SI_ALB_TIR_016]
MKNKLRFQVGQWVEGETWDKQRIYGYVVKVGKPADITKVYIVDSANEELRGRMIHVLSKSLQKVPEQTPVEAAIEQLIDLALLTKDQGWFEHLSKQLCQLRMQYS